MSSPAAGTEVLTQAECWELLEHATVGRLAVDVAGQPDIFPINYVVDGSTIIFRSGAGTKLAAAVLLHHVAFEIDGYEPDERIAWSVVVKGMANEVERMEERFAAEELPLFPWISSPKPTFVRITPAEVSGRRFHVVDTASPDESIGWEPTHVTDGGITPTPGAEYHPGAPRMRPD